MKCEICNTPISKKVEEYSKDKFKKVLCFDCQKKQTEPKQETKTTGLTKDDFWKNKEIKDIQKDNRISRHGALNTALQAIEIGIKYGSIDFTDGTKKITNKSILNTAELLAEDIIKWLNKKN